MMCSLVNLLSVAFAVTLCTHIMMGVSGNNTTTTVESPHPQHGNNTTTVESPHPHHVNNTTTTVESPHPHHGNNTTTTAGSPHAHQQQDLCENSCRQHFSLADYLADSCHCSPVVEGDGCSFGCQTVRCRCGTPMIKFCNLWCGGHSAMHGCDCSNTWRTF